MPIAGPNPSVVTPLEGITTRAASDGDVVTYADGRELSDAVATARPRDVAIVFVGDGASEGVDRHDPDAQDHDLHAVGCVPRRECADQTSWLRRCAAANPNTIVVLQTGAPVAMPWLSKRQERARDVVPGRAGRQRAAA